MAHGPRFALRSQPWNVIGPLALVQWLLLLLLTRRITHNGWLFAQDGDGTSSYSAAWSLAHGHLPPALVGYGWPFLTMPLAGVVGASYLDGLPALVLFETLIVAPLGLLAVYGVASRIGGRWLGYVAAACWILIPYVAIPLSSAGYREAYEQQLMPQALGLIGDGQLPGTICVLVAAYFAVSSLDTADRLQAALAGLFAGFAIAFDASNLLFLAAPALAYAIARRGRPALVFALALVPALATVALWHYRGLGHIPHFEAAIDTQRLELLRQGFAAAFYSDRLVEVPFIAGVIGLARRSWAKSAFVTAWFLPYLLVRGSAPGTDFGTGTWFGALMPAFPAFVIALCSVPLLVPRFGARLARAPGVHHPRRLPPRDPRVVAAGIGLAALPIVLVAALPVQTNPVLVAYAEDHALVPVVREFQPVTGTKPGTVYLQWPAAKKPEAATPFYVIFRSPASVPGGLGCTGGGAVRCGLQMQRLASTPKLLYADIAPPVPAGKWTYRIGLAANAQSDTAAGGLVLLSPPVDAVVPEG